MDAAAYNDWRLALLSPLPAWGLALAAAAALASIALAWRGLRAEHGAADAPPCSRSGPPRPSWRSSCSPSPGCNS